jgi:hypothetical protein
MFESASQIPKSIDQNFLDKSARRCVREFGVMIATIIVLYATYKWFFASQTGNFTYLATIAGAVALISYVMPQLLFPIWRVWMLLALLLNRIVTPLILGLMWFCMLVPIAGLLKIIGKRTLDTTFRQAGTTTYWRERDKKEDNVELFKRQF